MTQWLKRADGNCIFISATERENIDDLRELILGKVQAVYADYYTNYQPQQQEWQLLKVGYNVLCYWLYLIFIYV